MSTPRKTTLVALNEVPGPNFELHIGKKSAKGNWITWFWLLMFCASLGQLGGIIGGVGQAVSISIPLTSAHPCPDRTVVAGRQDVGEQRQVLDLGHGLVAVGELQQVEVRVGDHHELGLAADPAAHVDVAILLKKA